ncbi:glycosyltransferase family 2 protein [Butyrivibrio sp. VCB2001]|uniref:glycosyltransferase family 2 protein n=1 Tax=Butyrivibrio sp. VCB2001 TaxID=1280667 RepID=UPI00041FA004|nr:glycosyltransferase family 2 protein [Butyrivibrio sp. VCB2001]
MGAPLISVIVPVYNVEKYLVECIESILAQTYSSFELLLVDDGSKDKSGEICDEYKDKDGRIRVFHKENGGLSSARNKGIDEAKGDLFCFIDSDDTISIDYLMKLYTAITENQADMAICDIDAPKLSKVDLVYQGNDSMTSDEAKIWLYDNRMREYVLMVVAWNKLYKKALFDDVRYPVGRIHEDEFVIGPILRKCSKISFVKEKLYNYRDNDSGITSETKRLETRHLDGVDALDERIAQAVEDGDSSFAHITLKNALYKCARFYGDASRTGVNDMRKASFTKYEELFSQYKALLDTKQRLKYRLFLAIPSIFIRIYNP